MKEEKNNNLPTSTSSLGGGILESSKRKNPKRRLEIIISLVSIAILLAVVSFSYAYIKYDTEEQGINVLGTDCISISMQDVTGSITLQKAFPMTEENGEKTDPYTFTLTNNCSVGVNYQINLRIEDEGIQEDQKMPVEDNIATKIDDKTKVILNASNKVTKTEAEEESKDEYKISTEVLTLAPHATVEHSVRIWLDESAGNDTQNKIFKSKVVVEAIQNQIVDIYTEPLLNGADPVLGDGLIPVRISPTTGIVTKVNTSQEWYNYGEKEWANAIIPTDEAKDAVDQLGAGEIIKEDQIESYFVWIPKYKYRLFNDQLGDYSSKTGTEDKHNQAIEIVFGLDNTTNSDEKQECATPMLDNGVQGASGKIGECQLGDYMTHPAFLAFGGNGLWVGKFETGHDSGSVGSAINEYSNDLQKELIIKPNQYSWTNTNPATMHQLAYNYQRDLESHMMKNTEWGAVAYLTQSIYGRCSNETTCEEVTINNNSNYVTGFAGSSVSQGGVAADPGNDNENTYNYNNPKSTKASTTGNYTGIYDMSGGAYEYVMGVMYGTADNDKPASSYSSSYNSGFNGPYSTSSTSNDSYGKSKEDGISFPDAKYYDVYEYGTTYNDAEAYKRRILGDTTGEMGPFESSKGSCYDDYAIFVCSGSPWFHRGGSYYSGTRAGVFSLDADEGGKNSSNGFRLVLAPL